jgi:dTDP-glucose 4,6-dehydratase
LFGDIDVVINFASQSHVTRSVEDPVPFVTNNFNVMMTMLEYARTLPKLQSFIQISTDEVYGPAGDAGGHIEWEMILPSTPYSASKASQEAMAIAYWRTYNIPVVIVNTMNPLGEMQDPEKFLPSTIRKILNGDVVKLHVNHEGVSGSRSYIHAADLADALIFLVQRGDVTLFNDYRFRPDRWNVVGADEITNLELASATAQILGTSLNHENVTSYIPGHGGRYALDGTKLAMEGWQPRRRIMDVLPEIVEWTVKHPLWSER